MQANIPRLKYTKTKTIARPPKTTPTRQKTRIITMQLLTRQKNVLVLNTVIKGFQERKWEI